MKDKTILIIGASSGIGRATAIEAGKQGARVILAARSLDKLKSLKEKIIKDGGSADYIKCDVCSEKEVEYLVKVAVEQHGSIDVAIICAALQFIDRVSELDMDEVKQMFNTNVLGTISCSKRITSEMLKRKSGHIIFVSSVMGEAAFPQMVTYGTTKGAVNVFAKGLRREVSSQGITITVISPGHTTTGISDHLKDRIPEWYGQSSGSLKAEYVASKIVNTIKTRKKEVVIGRQNLMLTFLSRNFPFIADRIIRKITLS